MQLPDVSIKSYQTVLLLAVGMVMGILRSSVYARWMNRESDPQPLRLGNDQWINPLLACNDEKVRPSGIINSLERSLDELVDDHISKGNITAAGIYLRELNNSSSISINEDEKFYPASLNKIPIMITAYKSGEQNADFLKQSFVYEDETLYNFGQEVQPVDALVAGQSYTVEDAIQKMIIHSDNNGFYSLTQFLDPVIYRATHQDLQIPLVPDSENITDYMTPEQFSYFFRVLYNSTYLNREFSQKALSLLSKVAYERGLRAAVPANIPIAHKFGLLSNMAGEQVVDRELHDCGIVYHPERPYLLCVMTKSKADLDHNELTIQEVSHVVYETIENGS